MIDIQNLSAGYREGTVLRNVSITFPRGQLTVLLGPNGCGKSTLLKSILGLTTRREGKILLDGKDVASMEPAALARHISYLPQTRQIPDITVERLVLHGRYPYLRYPRRYRKEDYAIARRAMAQVGLGELAQTPLTELSGGTRQKAYIAMALAQDTETVLLDEPNAYLDIAHQLSLMELCRELAGLGKAVVLVLHDLNLAMAYGDQLVLMDQGSVVFRGTPEDVYQSGALNRVFEVEVLRHQTPQGYRYTCHKMERRN